MRITKKTIAILTFSALISGSLVFISQKQKAQANLLSNLIINADSDFSFTENSSIFASSNPSYPEPKVVSTVPMIVTAYSSTVCQTDNDPFITASNKWVRDGIIANNMLPFGTKIRIPELYGDKIFVVEDRMNRRKSAYHIDIWFAEYNDAKEFGVKNAYIEILEG